MNIINNKYILLERIDSGSFGTIYKGQNIRTKENVAIKVEPVNGELKLLKNETNIYKFLNGCDGIPSVKWFGRDSNNYYMVINLLGMSLQKLMLRMKKMPLILVLKLGIKIISLVKTIHEKGLVHRDIKPDNFLFGQDNINNLYLIDFGFCKGYDNEGKHISLKQTCSIIGSRNYASIMSHKKFELSRRDDLESVAYMLLYFINGTLPWCNEMNDDKIMALKNDIINNKSYPRVLLDFLIYVRQMAFEENPNYYLYIEKFKDEIMKQTTE